MQPHLVYFASCDDLILAETNVRKIERTVASTERGVLKLVYNGGYYYFTIDDEDVTTERLIEKVAPIVLEDFYKNYNKHGI